MMMMMTYHMKLITLINDDSANVDIGINENDDAFNVLYLVLVIGGAWPQMTLLMCIQWNNEMVAKKSHWLLLTDIDIIIIY